MDTTTIGIIGFAAMLALMFLGVPIGVAMGAVGFFGFAWVNGWNSALNMLALAPYSAVATYVLSVVPLFVLMGHLANETGIGRELYATAQIWLKHRRGGLAMATVAACAGLCRHQRLQRRHRRHHDHGGAAADAQDGLRPAGWRPARWPPAARSASSSRRA